MKQMIVSILIWYPMHWNFNTAFSIFLIVAFFNLKNFHFESSCSLSFLSLQRIWTLKKWLHVNLFFNNLNKFSLTMHATRKHECMAIPEFQFDCLFKHQNNLTRCQPGKCFLFWHKRTCLRFFVNIYLNIRTYDVLVARISIYACW